MRFRSFSIYALRYAAVAAIAIISTWFAFTQYSGLEDTTGTLIDVPKGQRVYITLADGTEAWLSPRTKVRVPNQFNKKNRVVELDVKVLGTKFNVFAYSESPRFETDLVEGSVQVYDREDQENNVILSPNEKAY